MPPTKAPIGAAKMPETITPSGVNSDFFIRVGMKLTSYKFKRAKCILVNLTKQVA
jgi:hypothetical protein